MFNGTLRYLDYAYYARPASNAVNGFLHNGHNEYYKCAETNIDGHQSWWMVDLGQVHTVYNVSIAAPYECKYFTLVEVLYILYTPIQDSVYFYCNTLATCVCGSQWVPMLYDYMYEMSFSLPNVAYTWLYFII